MSFISGLEVIKKGGRQRTLENEVVGVGALLGLHLKDMLGWERRRLLITNSLTFRSRVRKAPRCQNIRIQKIKGLVSAA